MQRLRDRTDKESICCFVLEDPESKESIYCFVLEEITRKTRKVIIIIIFGFYKVARLVW